MDTSNICDAGYFCVEGASVATPDVCVDVGYIGIVNNTCSGALVGSSPYGRCPPGHYCEAGTGSPLPCPNGTESTAYGLQARSDCQACRAGFYCNSTGIVVSSSPCWAGYYCPGGDILPTHQCPVGNYCSAGEEAPVPCDAGTYQNEVGQATCKTCPAGSFCETGSSTPEPCVAGHFCPAGTTFATEYACPIGTYSNATMLRSAAECTACSGGHYCDSAGLTEPTGLCTAGYFCGGNSTHPEPSEATAVGYTGETCVDTLAWYMALASVDGVNDICPRGHYCLAGSSAPVRCPPGTMSNSSGNTAAADCVGCSPGFLCDVRGTTVASTLCPGGYVCTGSDAAVNDSMRCSKGHYCPNGTHTPLRCPAGEYQDELGRASCKTCPAGFHCPGNGTGGSIVPDACPAGHYCGPGLSTGVETPCPAGTYSDVEQLDSQNQCKACPAGKYCGAAGLSAPTGNCSAGYYCTNGSDTATPSALFDAGYTGVGGFYELGNSTYANDACTPGHYCPPGSGAPVPCPQGTFSNATGLAESAQCLPCSAGYYCPRVGQVVATDPCTEGYFCPGGDKTPTRNCTLGDFCPEGSVSPIPCPAGRYVDTRGSGSCDACPERFYCPRGTSDPVPCPVGAYCPASTASANEHPCPPGTFSNETRLASDGECSLCTPGSYCAAYGLTSVEGLCGLGHYCGHGAEEIEPSGTDRTAGGPCDAGYVCLRGSKTARPSALISEALNLTSGAALGTGYICPAGNFCPIGSSAPVPCAPGTYQPGNASALCDPCPLGTRCPREGMTVPEDCPERFFCPAGSTNGLLCPGGTFGNISGLQHASDCEPCPSGMFCTDGTVTGGCAAGYFCLASAPAATPDRNVSDYSSTAAWAALDYGQCPPNHYCPAGIARPVACPEDRYRNDTHGSNATDCGPCPQGVQCSPGDALVRPCPSGYYCPLGVAPVACPRGKYNPSVAKTGVDDCFDCPEGYLCNSTALSNFTGTLCPAGAFCPRGALLPLPCPVGKYRDHAGGGGQASCGSCEPGYYCEDGSDGSANFFICPKGHFCPASSGNATTCPPGTYCPHEGMAAALVCPAGHACGSGTVDISLSETRCPRGTYCPNGTSIPRLCPAGYKGMNASLDRDRLFTSFADACDPCPPGTHGDTADQTECPACPAGYVCLGTTSKEFPTSRDEHNGFECPAGFFCPEGSREAVPCPAGKYNPLLRQSNVSACVPCPSDTYMHLSGSPECFPCTTSATAAAESTTCTCRGANRAFQPGDGQCICDSGFEFFDVNNVRQGAKDGDTDCQPIVYSICEEGEVRFFDGSCVTEDICEAVCDGGGDLVETLGLCECNDIEDLNSVCDAECQAALDDITLDELGRVFIGGQRTNVSVSDLVDAGSIHECVDPTLPCNLHQVKVDEEDGFSGCFGPCDGLGEYDGLRRRRLQDANASSTADVALRSPLACLHLGDSLLFSVSRASYPVYLKDSLMNTNEDFDYSDFRALETLMRSNSSSQFSAFGFTFDEPGTYTFAQSSAPQRLLLLTVMPRDVQCKTEATFVPARTDEYTKGNVAIHKDGIILEPDWELLVSLVVMLVVVVCGVMATLHCVRHMAVKRKNRRRRGKTLWQWICGFGRRDTGGLLEAKGVPDPYAGLDDNDGIYEINDRLRDHERKVDEHLRQQHEAIKALQEMFASDAESLKARLLRLEDSAGSRRPIGEDALARQVRQDMNGRRLHEAAASALEGRLRRMLGRLDALLSDGAEPVARSVIDDIAELAREGGIPLCAEDGDAASEDAGAQALAPADREERIARSLEGFFARRPAAGAADGIDLSARTYSKTMYDLNVDLEDLYQLVTSQLVSDREDEKRRRANAAAVWEQAAARGAKATALGRNVLTALRRLREIEDGDDEDCGRLAALMDAFCARLPDFSTAMRRADFACGSRLARVCQTGNEALVGDEQWAHLRSITGLLSELEAAIEGVLNEVSGISERNSAARGKAERERAAISESLAARFPEGEDAGGDEGKRKLAARVQEMLDAERSGDRSRVNDIAEQILDSRIQDAVEQQLDQIQAVDAAGREEDDARKKQREEAALQSLQGLHMSGQQADEVLRDMARDERALAEALLLDKQRKEEEIRSALAAQRAKLTVQGPLEEEAREEERRSALEMEKQLAALDKRQREEADALAREIAEAASEGGSPAEGAPVAAAARAVRAIHSSERAALEEQLRLRGRLRRERLADLQRTRREERLAEIDARLAEGAPEEEIRSLQRDVERELEDTEVAERRALESDLQADAAGMAAALAEVQRETADAGPDAALHRLVRKHEEETRSLREALAADGDARRANLRRRLAASRARRARQHKGLPDAEARAALDGEEERELEVLEQQVRTRDEKALADLLERHAAEESAAAAPSTPSVGAEAVLALRDMQERDLASRMSDEHKTEQVDLEERLAAERAAEELRLEEEGVSGRQRSLALRRLKAAEERERQSLAEAQSCRRAERLAALRERQAKLGASKQDLSRATNGGGAAVEQSLAERKAERRRRLKARMRDQRSALERQLEKSNAGGDAVRSVLTELSDVEALESERAQMASEQDFAAALQRERERQKRMRGAEGAAGELDEVHAVESEALAQRLAYTERQQQAALLEEVEAKRKAKELELIAKGVSEEELQAAAEEAAAEAAARRRELMDRLRAERLKAEAQVRATQERRVREGVGLAAAAEELRSKLQVEFGGLKSDLEADGKRRRRLLEARIDARNKKLAGGLPEGAKDAALEVVDGISRRERAALERDLKASETLHVAAVGDLLSRATQPGDAGLAPQRAARLRGLHLREIASLKASSASRLALQRAKLRDKIAGLRAQRREQLLDAPPSELRAAMADVDAEEAQGMVALAEEARQGLEVALEEETKRLEDALAAGAEPEELARKLRSAHAAEREGLLAALASDRAYRMRLLEDRWRCRRRGEQRLLAGRSEAERETALRYIDEAADADARRLEAEMDAAEHAETAAIDRRHAEVLRPSQSASAAQDLTALHDREAAALEADLAANRRRAARDLRFAGAAPLSSEDAEARAARAQAPRERQLREQLARAHAREREDLENGTCASAGDAAAAAALRLRERAAAAEREVEATALRRREALMQRLAAAKARRLEALEAEGADAQHLRAEGAAMDLEALAAASALDGAAAREAAEELLRRRNASRLVCGDASAPLGADARVAAAALRAAQLEEQRCMAAEAAQRREARSLRLQQRLEARCEAARREAAALGVEDADASSIEAELRARLEEESLRAMGAEERRAAEKMEALRRRQAQDAARATDDVVRAGALRERAERLRAEDLRRLAEERHRDRATLQQRLEDRRRRRAAAPGEESAQGEAQAQREEEQERRRLEEDARLRLKTLRDRSRLPGAAALEAAALASALNFSAEDRAMELLSAAAAQESAVTSSLRREKERELASLKQDVASRLAAAERHAAERHAARAASAAGDEERAAIDAALREEISALRSAAQLEVARGVAALDASLAEGEAAAAAELEGRAAAAAEAARGAARREAEEATERLGRVREKHAEASERAERELRAERDKRLGALRERLRGERERRLRAAEESGAADEEEAKRKADEELEREAAEGAAAIERALSDEARAKAEAEALRSAEEEKARMDAKREALARQAAAAEHSSDAANREVANLRGQHAEELAELRDDIRSDGETRKNALRERIARRRRKMEEQGASDAQRAEELASAAEEQRALEERLHAEEAERLRARAEAQREALAEREEAARAAAAERETAAVRAAAAAEAAAREAAVEDRARQDAVEALRQRHEKAVRERREAAEGGRGDRKAALLARLRRREEALRERQLQEKERLRSAHEERVAALRAKLEDRRGATVDAASGVAWQGAALQAMEAEGIAAAAARMGQEAVRRRDGGGGGDGDGEGDGEGEGDDALPEANLGDDLRRREMRALLACVSEEKVPAAAIADAAEMVMSARHNTESGILNARNLAERSAALRDAIHALLDEKAERRIEAVAGAGDDAQRVQEALGELERSFVARQREEEQRVLGSLDGIHAERLRELRRAQVEEVAAAVKELAPEEVVERIAAQAAEQHRREAEELRRHLEREREEKVRRIVEEQEREKERRAQERAAAIAKLEAEAAETMREEEEQLQREREKRDAELEQRKAAVLGRIDAAARGGGGGAGDREKDELLSRVKEEKERHEQEMRDVAKRKRELLRKKLDRRRAAQEERLKRQEEESASRAQREIEAIDAAKQAAEDLQRVEAEAQESALVTPSQAQQRVREDLQRATEDARAKELQELITPRPDEDEDGGGGGGGSGGGGAPQSPRRAGAAAEEEGLDWLQAKVDAIAKALADLSDGAAKAPPPSATSGAATPGAAAAAAAAAVVGEGPWYQDEADARLSSAGRGLVEIEAGDLDGSMRGRLGFLNRIVGVLGMQQQLDRVAIASSLPEPRGSAHNAFRNSYHFDAPARRLYLHVQRAQDSGDAALVLTHALAHIRAGGDHDDRSPAFVAELHRTMRTVSRELFRWVGSPAGASSPAAAGAAPPRRRGTLRGAADGGGFAASNISNRIRTMAETSGNAKLAAMLQRFESERRS